MNLKLGSCVLLSLNLLILLVAYETEARKMVEENSESMFDISEDNHHQQAILKQIYGSGYPFQGADDHHQQEISDFGNPWKRFKYNEEADDQVNHQQEENHDQVKMENNEHVHDHSSSFFFLMDDLKKGKTKTLSFQKRKKLISSPSSSPGYFFPKEAANSIPFSTKQLPEVLQRFSISKNSPQAKSMEDTLRACEDSPVKGETKYCATSAEAMLDYVQRIMGDKTTQFEALSTTTYFDSVRARNYTILDDPQEVSAPKMVACHVLPYAHTAILYCHHTVSKVKVFKVSLGYEEGGDRVVEAIAVCHLDTSQWNPAHESLRELGILPGTSPVCHFFTSSNDLVWLPKPFIATKSALKHPSS